jgi:hypothetical protein
VFQKNVILVTEITRVKELVSIKHRSDIIKYVTYANNSKINSQLEKASTQKVPYHEKLTPKYYQTDEQEHAKNSMLRQRPQSQTLTLYFQ